MSLTTLLARSAVVSTSACLGAAGLLISAPAHADAGCTLPDGPSATLELQSPDPTRVQDVFVESHGTTLGPQVSVTSNGGNTAFGTATGGINGRNVDFTVNWVDNPSAPLPADQNPGPAHFSGVVGDDGILRGIGSGKPRPINIWMPGSFVSSGPLTCAAPAAAAPPKDAIVVDVEQSPTSVSVNVKNTSALAGKCTYDATPTNGLLMPPVHRDFNLNANDSTKLDFLAPPLGVTYHLVVRCHGNFNGQDDEFGHFEQDVTGGL
jgi:hypothetical protein